MEPEKDLLLLVTFFFKKEGSIQTLFLRNKPDEYYILLLYISLLLELHFYDT